MWSQLRAQMVEQLLWDETECLAKHVTSHVTKFEYHPLSVQDLKEAVQCLKKAKKSWKQYRMAEFEFDMPIPEMPALPEQYTETRSNRWTFIVYFMYNPTKKIFKVEMWKHATRQAMTVSTFDFSRQEYKFSRRDTTKEDLDSDTFLYYLRDMMGKYFVKLKQTQVCGRIKDNWNGCHKVMCGYSVEIKGAMCQACRNKHLKRKFKHM